MMDYGTRNATAFAFEAHFSIVTFACENTPMGLVRRYPAKFLHCGINNSSMVNSRDASF
jgi:hypothetical protein